MRISSLLLSVLWPAKEFTFYDQTSETRAFKPMIDIEMFFSEVWPRGWCISKSTSKYWLSSQKPY